MEDATFVYTDSMIISCKDRREITLGYKHVEWDAVENHMFGGSKFLNDATQKSGQRYPKTRRAERRAS